MKGFSFSFLALFVHGAGAFVPCFTANNERHHTSVAQPSFQRPGMLMAANRNGDEGMAIRSNEQSRRAFGSSAASVLIGGLASSLFPQRAFGDEEEASAPPSAPSTKVLVLGATGLVGSEVCKQLISMGVDVVCTSRNGRGGTVAFDVLTPGMKVDEEVAKLAKGCTAVISTIGSILTPDDAKVNAATGLAAIGAKSAGVKHFVYITNAPEVVDSVGGFDFIKPYMEGKASSEQFIKANFGTGEAGVSYTLIQPTFIYGGEKFGLNPPRVSTGYGSFIEGTLSLPPFKAAAGVLPGLVGVALEAPVSAKAVAGAAVAGALSDTSVVLDTHDKIVAAAS